MAKASKDLMEKIDSEQRDSEVSLHGYDILGYPADFTLEVLVGKWKKGEISVPLLQRRFIWSQVRASKLIESFLMGLPVPPVFFYQERNTNKLLVVDGHQRLRSIVYFFSGRFGEPVPGVDDIEFSLVGLDEKSPYLDATYRKLKDNNEAAFNKLTNSVLRSFVVKQLDPQDDTSIFQIFERLTQSLWIMLRLFREGEVFDLAVVNPSFRLPTQPIPETGTEPRPSTHTAP